MPKLAEVIGIANESTYFVGHSMGCQTIARYLESLPEGAKVGGAVFVAGFFKRLTGLENSSDVQETNKHWFGTPLDLEKVKSHLPKSIAIFSDDDPFVPLDNQEDFRNKLNSEIIIERSMGHFSGSDGVTELPMVLNSLLKNYSIKSMEIFAEVVGWIGAFLVVLAYFLVSHKKVQGDSRIYQLMNLIGAIGVGINASYQEAWPSFMIQVVWGLIAIITLIKSLKS